ncbi:MAG: SAM hydroxide adenosyltransferase [Burkholderiales bacterium]
MRRAWPKARSVSCTSTQHPSGNAITGIRAALARSAQSLVVRDNTLRRGRVFSDTAMGELFWYENSIGLIENRSQPGERSASARPRGRRRCASLVRT